jgi:TetR/AcrR family transcriptional regulator, regulator of cefoperazone and chloramphenicol sensitivity
MRDDMCAQKASGSTETVDGSDTRQRVVEAAISCILERGFYRASSNAIAEQAGLTWGVIQYYFGTREALMLAVLEEASRRLSRTLGEAEITGSTLTERVEQFFDVLADYYGSPDYLAFIQVQLNLGHDPRTSERTRENLAELNERANPQLKRLMAKVVAGKSTGKRRKNLTNLLFHALRGVSISHVMLGTVPMYEHNPPGDFLAERRLLARAMSLLIEQELGG